MNHQNNDQHSSMMWLMMLMCGLPLVIVLFGGRLGGGFNWLTIVIIAIFILGHYWLMRRGGCGHKSTTETTKEDVDQHNKKNNQDNKSCH